MYLDINLKIEEGSINGVIRTEKNSFVIRKNKDENGSIDFHRTVFTTLEGLNIVTHENNPYATIMFMDEQEFLKILKKQLDIFK